MSKKLELYVTTVVVEVLSTYPYSCNGNIAQLEYDISNYQLSGIVREEKSRQVNQEKFVELCGEHDVNPLFFEQCPFCSSTKISERLVTGNSENSTVCRYRECKNCRKRWKDIYKSDLTIDNS